VQSGSGTAARPRTPRDRGRAGPPTTRPLQGRGPAPPHSLTLSLVLSVSWSPPAASPSRGGGAPAPPGPGQPPRCRSSSMSRSRVAGLASSSAPPPRSRAGSPPERHQRASARGRRQGVRTGAGGDAAPLPGAPFHALAPGGGGAARPSLAPRDRATRPAPPSRRRAPAARSRAAGPAPLAPPRCTAVPEAPPRAMTSMLGPCPGSLGRWGHGKVRERPRTRDEPGTEERGGEPGRRREVLLGAGMSGGVQLTPPRDSALLDTPQRGGASQASPSRNLLGRTDPLALRSSQCLTSLVPGDELANSFNIVPRFCTGETRGFESLREFLP
jgi:hypothetical protein